MQWLHALEVRARVLLGWVLVALLWRPGRSRRVLESLAARRRVLLVRIDNRVGEALLTTPLVGALSTRGYRVEVLVHPKCVRMFEGLDGVAAIHAFERASLWSLGETGQRLRALGRDAIVVNCANWSAYSGTAAIAARLAAPDSPVVGPSTGPSRFLSDLAVEALPGVESERLQRSALLRPVLGFAPDEPMSFRTPRPTDAVRAWLRAAPPFVVVNPGGRLDERRVSAAAFAAAARAAVAKGFRVLVTWGPGEEGLAAQVAQGAPGAEVAMPTTIDDLAALMTRARLVVCNNTGPMHLSVAVGAPTLAAFRAISMARWGHAFGSHQMVDLTLVSSQDAALAVAVEQALARLG